MGSAAGQCAQNSATRALASNPISGGLLFPLVARKYLLFYFCYNSSDPSATGSSPSGTSRVPRWTAMLEAEVVEWGALR